MRITSLKFLLGFWTGMPIMIATFCTVGRGGLVGPPIFGFLEVGGKHRFLCHRDCQGLEPGVECTASETSPYLSISKRSTNIRTAVVTTPIIRKIHQNLELRHSNPLRERKSYQRHSHDEIKYNTRLRQTCEIEIVVPVLGLAGCHSHAQIAKQNWSLNGSKP